MLRIGRRLKIGGIVGTLLLAMVALYAVWQQRYAAEQLDYQQARWQACGVDDDCVVVPSVCPGFFWSINGKFVADNEAQNVRLAPLVDCGPPPDSIRPLRPFCRAGQCVMPR